MAPVPWGSLSWICRDRARVIGPGTLGRAPVAAEVVDGREPCVEYRLLRDAEVGPADEQDLKRGQGGETRGQRSGQLPIRLESQAPEVHEAAKLGGNRTGESVCTELQLVQAGEVTKFRRDRTCQLIQAEREGLEAREVAELRRD